MSVMYTNPVLYADYSDPDVIRVGSDFYMIASSFTYLPGVPLLHSKDLVHWELINYCVDRLPYEKYSRPSHGSGTWAPSLRYHNGEFIAFIPLVDEGILVARSQDPYGKFEINLLCESKGWIDPCPLFDEDGKAYMVFAYARSRCGIKHRLMIVEIDPECTRLIGEPKLIFDGEQIAPTTEGPKIYKKDGWYYILMPSGGVATGWQSCLRSRSVYGPYEYRIVMHQGNADVNGPHQGGWVSTEDGKDWFIHFQDVIELGRITHLQPMCFINGWPFIGADTNGDGIGEPVQEWSMPVEGAPQYRIATSDTFSGDRLGLQWQWQANPDDRNYSMTANPDALRLYCRSNAYRENLLWYAPNALTQIPQAKALEMTAKVCLHAEQDGDAATIGMIGQEYGYLALVKTKAGYELRCMEGKVLEKEFEGLAKESCLSSVSLKQKETKESCSIYLKLVLKDNKRYELGYSEDGIHFIMMEKQMPLQRATWTGAKLCIWSCNLDNRESDGYADYEWVEIR